ncbi:MAG: N-6 DNA methylase [Verrucomicrobia bacterium]|nr:N-6 DNA methylase [Verrucomicrobiota bacterium]MCG2679643.1 N-6 DNA methylase [Kiritimatiellia bacterium]MBU4247956.1 N-6 DNA methylase [Verrucomicrobiota bacterium]MBU4291453.1 N-6 DNA methylase [Verrucomicrobiota bacterium]MBU4428367.1 N-6 DNA methylase [Verrucomicrobiota bacterium]
MLDSETKARIDSARDILVGKVPDPKSQVEQITIALIYKFMDDMDRQSEEIGGKATFFTGEFKKYRWAQLLDKRFGGHERLLLYAEGIEKMNENKNIPQLFRDIFKGVFLPYRDPETLNLFLKEINGFTYEHSERLGDAFEYLLSVLGTQGDAGQFRTPRHIIDFIVAVVDPNKNETVLDPACGTAGFLISAYKHILKANDNLSPDERARLMTNFCGYDIAPDMVRLSRANLYLHGFPNPVIYEYDTLTSEERWDERCDVIMANPPFMSPTGGIRPHNRFSIRAKRSEVLFVDYIAEHLNPGGRAGVIVPEGIIFQSQNAYKALRKMLVENYLWAVVSLPAGVFNPYSGVKTSILFLDRNLAKRTNEVLFVKVENDGFDLGAQRRPNGGSQLAEALKALSEWRTVAGDGGPGPASPRPATARTLPVSRKRLLESPDINLSGDRYRVAVVRHVGKWPMVKLGEVAKISAGNGAPQDEKYFSDGTVPFFRTSDVGAVHISADLQVSRDRLTDTAVTQLRLTVWPKGTILFPKSGASTFLNHRVMLGCPGVVSSHLATIVADETKVGAYFLFHLMCHVGAKSLTEDQNYPSLRLGDLERIEIPLPPLDEQERIVAELEGYRKMIEGVRQILAAYKPTIRVDPEWPMVTVGDVVEFVSGLTVSIPEVESEGGTPIIAINNVTEDGKLTLDGMRWIKPPKKTLNYVQKGDLLFNWRNGSKHLVGKTALFDLDGQYLFASFLLGIRAHPDQVNSRYLWYTLNIYRREGRYMQFMRQNVNGLFNREELKIVVIPLPPLAIQRQIVAELEAERKLVEANRELIARMEAKIKAKLAEVWAT